MMKNRTKIETGFLWELGTSINKLNGEHATHFYFAFKSFQGVSSI